MKENSDIRGIIKEQYNTIYYNLHIMFLGSDVCIKFIFMSIFFIHPSSSAI